LSNKTIWTSQTALNGFVFYNSFPQHSAGNKFHESLT